MKKPGASTQLTAEQVYAVCDIDSIPFESSDEVTTVGGPVGQQRALDALSFGTGMRDDGYNIFALGPAGLGKRTVIQQLLERQSQIRPAPSDWCYVYNFSEPYKPNALQLPAGRGIQLRKDMEQFTEDLLTAIPAAFETENYQAQIESIQQELIARRDEALNELAEQANEKNIQLIHTPSGFAFAPMDAKKEVIRPDRFERLTETEQEQIKTAIDELQKQLQRVIRQFPAWQKESQQQVKELDRKIAHYAVEHLISEVKEHHADLGEVVSFLSAVESDVIEHAKDFRGESEVHSLISTGAPAREHTLHRYEINLIVDRSDDESAPVVYIDLPTHSNLLGRTEYQTQMGTLVTDFTLIKAGELHRANGGYLLLDARHLLTQPFAWESLKRALRSKEIRIEPLERSLGLVSTVSLEPEPIPLDVKVVLMGERLLYYLLVQYDPEFVEFFKVAADFEDALDRDGDNTLTYARQIACFVNEHKLTPIGREGTARVIEHAIRLAGDNEKISLELRNITDLLKEADYWARQQKAARISAQHVQQAIDSRIDRLERVRSRVYEAITSGVIDIESKGGRIGQLNGLSVIQLGEFAFGQPTRITATARLGDRGVIDIERETKLGGKLHSKGVLILSNFLAARFAKDYPLSLSASLVFEQSYGMVDGDSASLAELCALLSVLGQVPIEQRFAVTGSVNQLGRVQAIGGVNEKIEGFFDICASRGLSGDQGVLIPASNQRHLMLRGDIVDAVRDGRFRVYTVETVDEAIEILTGTAAGERDEAGDYPGDSVNGLVEERLFEFAKARRRFSHPNSEDKTPSDSEDN